MAHFVQSVRGVPKILDMVDVDSEKWLQYSSHSSFPMSWLWASEGRRLAKHEESLVSHFTTTLVCTEAERDTLCMRVGADRVYLVGNVLDTDYFDPASVKVPDEIARWAPYVVFSGAMDYRPNVDAVVYFCRNILPLARQKVPELRFV